jgi:hypothetical protein
MFEDALSSFAVFRSRAAERSTKLVGGQARKDRRVRIARAKLFGQLNCAAQEQIVHVPFLTRMLRTGYPIWVLIEHCHSAFQIGRTCTSQLAFGSTR